MIIIAAILVLIVILSIILILKPNKQKKLSEPPKTEDLPEKPKEEIEILDLNDYDENTLDLDDLFKTISITKIEDDPNFDFDLRKTTKKS